MQTSGCELTVAVRRGLAALLVACALAALTVRAAQSDDTLRLRVSQNGRHLVDGDGRPFF